MNPKPMTETQMLSCEALLKAGRNYETIATLLGVTLDAVKRHIGKVRQRIAEKRERFNSGFASKSPRWRCPTCKSLLQVHACLSCHLRGATSRYDAKYVVKQRVLITEECCDDQASHSLDD